MDTLTLYKGSQRDKKQKKKKKKKKCEEPSSGTLKGSSRVLGSSLAPSLGNVKKVLLLLRRISFPSTRHTLLATLSWSFSLFRVGRKEDDALSETT